MVLSIYGAPIGTTEELQAMGFSILSKEGAKKRENRQNGRAKQSPKGASRREIEEKQKAEAIASAKN